MEKIELADALLLTWYASLELGVPPRAIYDTGWIIKRPLDIIPAINALIELQELVNAHYGRKEDDEDTTPPYEKAYFEAGDGGKDWTEDADTEGRM